MANTNHKQHKPQEYEGITLLDLIQRYRGQAIQTGKALGLADAGGTRDRLRMGRYFASMRTLGETETELHRRLGLVVGSMELTNRAAFIFLATQRAHGTCHRCTRKRTIKGQALNYWTKVEPFEPLPLLMAWGGASVEQIRRALVECSLMCRACAKARGGRLLGSGNVDLRAYDVDPQA